MATTTKQTLVGAQQRYKVTYEYRKFLGFLGYWSVAKVEQLDNDLYLEIGEVERFKNIYINGKPYLPKK